MRKKRIAKIFIPVSAMIASVILLLSGCHQGSREELPLTPSQRGNGKQTEIKSDSLKEDSIKAFYERMRRWDALHGGMRQRESDK
ncbi:MAG: hypothetical protein K6A94_06550 [Bacteroidales bacterium]|jgi:hypothetical protein|nr:hypothetical protein [Bacteroidales bacterium]